MRESRQIFTISGYLVNTIEHNQVFENGTESWNLLSRDNLEIAYETWGKLNQNKSNVVVVFTGLSPSSHIA